MSELSPKQWKLHSLCISCLLKKEAMKGALEQEFRNLELTLSFPGLGTSDHFVFPYQAPTWGTGPGVAFCWYHEAQE